MPHFQYHVFNTTRHISKIRRFHEKKIFKLKKVCLQIVEKQEIHCHAKFVSSNQLRVKFFSKKLISRNFCEKMVAVKFRNIHTFLAKIS